MKEHATEPQIPRPSDVELLAGELERMAQRATHQDHFESPIVDAILQAPSARPFVGALRVLVGQLTRDGEGAPNSSIVLRLLRESDLDVAVKLELLREFLLCEKRDYWEFNGRDDFVRALKKGDDTLASTLIHLLRTGGRAAMVPVVGWLGDQQLRSRAHVTLADVADNLLSVLAEETPSAVLDELAPMPSSRAMGALSRIAGLHPNEGMTFVRRSMQEGASYQAVVALTGLEQCEPLREEVREIATAIASDPSEGGVRATAFAILLALPTIAPTVWELLREAPYQHRYGLSYFRVGARLREGGLLEALDVLEHWMRAEEVPEPILGHICMAFGAALGGLEAVVLSEDVQKRVVADLAEAWRRGASVGDVARAVESALYGRSDAQYASLGLGELAGALAATGSECRSNLLYALASRSSRGAAWTTRLLAQVADAADFQGKLRCVRELAREGSRPDGWSETEIVRLLTACRPSMTGEDAASACLSAAPRDGVNDGLRPILAWFAREFPGDAAIRAALAHVMRGEDSRVAGEVEWILRRAVGKS